MSVEKATECNCEYCYKKKVIGLEEETTIHTRQIIYEKDGNDGGNRTICARDRDSNDRTFPSVCHMSCHNRCTRFRKVAVKKNNVTKYVVIAYRSNYYKLKNGSC